MADDKAEQTLPEEIDEASGDEHAACEEGVSPARKFSYSCRKILSSRRR